jgi:hypothetical protein
MNVERRFKRSAYKRVLELAQAHEQATPDSPTKRALSAALDAIALPQKDPTRPAGRAIPLTFPRLTPVRGDVEFREWCAIGEQYVAVIHELDLAVETLHQCLAKLAQRRRNRFGIEWRPYDSRASGRERGLFKPVFFKANRRARTLPARGEQTRRFVVSEIPLESMRANMAHADFFPTPDCLGTARLVLAELRTVLALREDLAATVNSTITRAGYWERPGKGGLGVARDALKRVGMLKIVAEDHGASSGG